MDVKLKTIDLNVYFGDHHVLHDINISIPQKTVTAIIGPSGCGKTTLLRTFNRLGELSREYRHTGDVLLDGNSIFKMDPVELRRKVGMVFQKPNPFPMSIFDNVAYGLRLKGEKNKTYIQDKVEEALKRAWLWNEVKDRLKKPAFRLSGGQQQRLCIARAIAVEPEVLLMDEPTSALDPASTSKIEELITELKSSYTIIIVTHNMQQAARVSRYTAFLLNGKLIEFNKTKTLFTNPQDNRTEAYITGRFG